MRSKMRSIGSPYLMNPAICSMIRQNTHKDFSVEIDAETAEILSADLKWSYDGSSTGQASGHDSEVLLQPVYIVPNAYKNGKYQSNKYFFALCETLDKDGNPMPNNYYSMIKNKIRENQINEPYLSFEQEFFIMPTKLNNPTQMDNNPVGMSQISGIYCNHQNTQQYYCSIGSENVVNVCRNIIERVYHWGILSGLVLSGYNAEVSIGQWEIQVGPSYNIRACHELWIVRYMLKIISEEIGLCISFHPKPLDNWNGSGLHTNYSNKYTRNAENGMQAIEDICRSLGNRHGETMQKYGEDNHLRMTGAYETASFNQFTFGVANRGCSIRIPRNVAAKGYGYLEDRRPASNADPYNIYSILTNADAIADVDAVAEAQVETIPSSSSD